MLFFALAYHFVTRGKEPYFHRSLFKAIVTLWVTIMGSGFIVIRFNLVQRVFALETDVQRGIAVLVVWPVIREILIMANRKVSFELKDHNPEGDQVFARQDDLLLHSF